MVRNAVRIVAKRVIRRAATAMAAAAIVFALAGRAQAEPWGGGAWTGSVDAVWGTGGNWSQGVIPGTRLNVALFNGTGNGRTTIDLTSAVGIENLIFDTSNAAAYTIGSGAVGSQTISLISNSRGKMLVNTDVDNDQLFNANASITGNYAVIQKSTQSTLTFAGGIWSASGASALNIYGEGNTVISGIIANYNGTSGPTFALTKTDAGTLTLSNNNTYTGATTVSGGTLTLTGSLSSSSPLTFGGPGIFNLDNVGDTGALSQSLGALTFNAGEGTVKTTRTEAFDEAITFSSLAARTAGATGNFVNTGTSSASNGFKFTAAPTAGALIDKGIFYKGSQYATYDSGGFVRGFTTGDTGYLAAPAGSTIGASTSTSNVDLTTGNINAQTTASANTINMRSYDLTLQDSSQILSVNGILSSGSANAQLATAGKLQATAAGNEIVIRVDGSSDSLTIASKIRNYGVDTAGTASALTKSGAGKLTLNAVNTYTGTTTVNAGTLAYGVNDAIVNTGAVTINGGTLDMATYSDTVGAVTLTAGSITGSGTLTGTSYTMNNPGATSVSAVLAGNVGLTKSDWGTLTLSNNNTYTGVTTITRGVLEVTSLKNGGEPSSIGASSSAGANLTFITGDGQSATLRYIGPATTTDRLIQIGGYFDAVIDASGTGALKFTNTGAMNTINGTNNASWLELTGSNTDDNTIDFVITNGRNTMNLYKTGVGKWILTGANTHNGIDTPSYIPWGGSTRIMGGTLAVTWLANGGVASPLGISTNAAAKLVLDGGTLQYLGSDARGGTTDRLFTLGVGSTAGALDASGPAGFPLVFTNTGSMGFSGTGTRTLTLTGTNTDANRLAAAIGNQSTNATSLVKSGTGVWTLSGASTYTGNTTVSQGTLNLTGSLGNTDVMVSNGAFLGGEATIGTATGGSLTFNNGATLRLNGYTAGAMTVGSGTTGSLTLTGTINVVLDATPPTVGIGSAIRLLNYNGTLTGNESNLSLVDSGKYRNPVFSTATAKQVNLTIDTQSLAWKGTTDGKWDINTTANWNSPGENFYQGDAVTFDDSATTKAVILNTTVLPASVAFTNTTGNDYTLSGTGGIAGAVVLTKNGTGAVTISTANSYTGATTISAGTLKLGATGNAANSPLGTTAAGTTVFATGAALDLNGFSLGTAEALTLNGTGVSGNGALTNSSSTAATYKGPITLGSASSIVSATGDINLSSTATISGATLGLTLGGVGANSTVASVIGTTSGTLTKEGAGTWTLSAANTYTGVTTISGGTLKLANQLAVQSSTLTMNGGSLVFDSSAGTAFTFGGLAASSSGTGYDIALENNAGTPAAVALTVGGNNADTTYAASLSGAGSLTKTGIGVLTLSASNSYTGLTTVSGGALRLNHATALPGGIGSTGGTSALTLSGGVIETSGNFLRPVSTDKEGVQVLAGSSGFSAWGNPLTVDLDGDGMGTGPTLTWGSTSFNPTTLVLNAVSANNTLNFKNPVILGASARAVNVNAAAAYPATMSGLLSGAGGGITKGGTGTLILSASNSYTGVTTVSAGVLSVSTLANAGSNSSIGAYATPGATGLVLGGGTLQYTGSNMETAITRGFTLSTANSTINVSPENTALKLGASSLGGFTLNVTGGSGSSLSLDATTVTGNATFAPNVPLTLASLTGSNQSVTFGGTSTSTVTGATTFSDSATITANGTLSLSTIGETATAAKTITLGGTGTGSVSGAITQTGANALALTKTGTGTWTLSGTNTYTGITTISGVLQVPAMAAGGVASPIGQSANAAANLVISGGTLRYTGSGATGGTTDRLFTLGTTATAGTLDASGATGSPMVFNNTGAMATSGTGVRTLTLTGSNTDANTLAAVIGNQSTNATSLTKTGSGKWVLGGANTYTGVTTISGGVLEVITMANGGVASSIGQSTNAAANLVINGGALQYTGSAPTGGTTDHLFTLGTGTTAGTLNASGASGSPFVLNNTVAMGFTVGGTRTLTLAGTNTDANTLAAVIGDSGGATSLVKTGIGKWILSGVNTYTGTTSVNDGTLVVGNALALQNSTLDTSGGGTILIASGLTSLTFVSLAGPQDLTMPSSVTSLTLKPAAGRVDTYSGDLLNAAPGMTLIINGAATGTQVLSGAFSHTGATTLTNSILSVGEDANLGNANSLIFDGGTLRVTDTSMTSFGSHTPTFNATKTVGLDIADPLNTFGVSQVLNQTTGGLIKSGAGKLVLSGTASNTYSGLTTVNAGTLELNRSGTLQAIAGGGLTVNSGALVKYTGSSTDMMGTGAVTINGMGQLDFNGQTDTIGNVSIVATGATADTTPIRNSTAAAGNLTIGTLGITPVAGYVSQIDTNGGTLTLGGTMTLTAATTGRARISGNLALGATRTLTVGAGTGADYDLLIDAVVSGGALTKNGAGRLKLTGGGTLSSAAISAGTLIASASTLAVSGDFTVDPATMNVNASGIVNTAGNFTVNGGLSVDNSSQLNMTAGGKTLNFKAGAYTLDLANTPGDSKFSVPTNTNLQIANAPYASISATLNLGPGSSGVQFNTLFMLLNNYASGNTATLNVNDSTVSFSGLANLGGEGVAHLNVTGGAVVNFGNDIVLRNANTTVAVDSTSRINMTTAGRTFQLAGANYSFDFSNTPGNGKVSVPTNTNLRFDGGVNTTLNLGPGSNGVQFDTLFMLQNNYNGGNTATLNVDNATVGFSGAANIGGEGVAHLNVTGGAVVNFGNDVILRNASTTFTLDSLSRINMTTTGRTFQLAGANYSLDFSNTPGNGKVSVPTNTNLRFDGGVNTTLNLGSESSGVQFNTLFMLQNNGNGGNTATLNLNNTTVGFSGASNIGGEGRGTLTLQNNSTVNFGSTLALNRSSTVSKIQGNGTLAITGAFTNNGRVIADGGALTVSYASWTRTGTPAAGDGWYATNGGKLTLPALSITGATAAWGELTSATTPLYVNSVRMETFTGGDTTGSLGISLLEKTNAAVLPGLDQPVGIWDFSSSNLSISSVLLKFRYDDVAAGSGENTLRLFQNTGSGWTEVISGFVRDTTANVITGTAGAFSTSSQFALAQALLPTVWTWKGGTSGQEQNWEAGNNWTPTTVPTSAAGTELIFGAATTVNATAQLNGDRIAGKITFQNGTGTTIAAGTPAGTLTLNNNGIAATVTVEGGTHAISSGVQLADNAAFGVTAGQLTLDGVISESPAASAKTLTKSGAGLLELAGTASTYTGKTTVSAGTLKFSSLGNLGAASSLGAPTTTANGTIVLGSATLQFAGTSTSTTNRMIDLVGDGVLDASGEGTELVFDNGATGIVLGHGNDLILSGNGTGRFKSPVSTSIPLVAAEVGNLIKQGEGTWILEAASTYTGSTTVSSGTLVIGSAGALPSGRSLSIGSGGTLILGGGMAMGQTAAASAEPVPEPGTLALLAIAALAGWFAWRRRKS